MASPSPAPAMTPTPEPTTAPGRRTTPGSHPEHDRQARLRYKRGQLVFRGGRDGRLMADVVDKAEVLTHDQCVALARSFYRVSEELRPTDLNDQWLEAFRYIWPFPDHPPNLYAIDATARAVMNYAALAARERAGVVLGAASPDVGLVERATVGMILALTADVAARDGWYMPVDPALVPALGRAWTEVMGEPAEAWPAPWRETRTAAAPPGGRLRSQMCTEADLRSAAFARCADAIRPAWDPDRSEPQVPLNRKLWEWLFIIRALEERGMLTRNRRGLGFGVGTEPLVSYFAARGCKILATDLDRPAARSAGWECTNQYAGSIDGLNAYGLCDPRQFRRKTSFRIVDMNHVPADLQGFDFNWSSCVIEHLGSIDRGREFMLRQMQTLRPGGVAVHTTELNASSDDETVEEGGTVIFRRRDIERMAEELRAAGHRVECDFSFGVSPADLHVDSAPYSSTHLKVELAGYTTTSFGLLIEKRGTLGPAWPTLRGLARSAAR